ELAIEAHIVDRADGEEPRARTAELHQVGDARNRVSGLGEIDKQQLRRRRDVDRLPRRVKSAGADLGAAPAELHESAAYRLPRDVVGDARDETKRTAG